MSHRDIEVSYESIRMWCNKFGPHYARRLKRRHQGYGDTFYIDEVFVKIRDNRNIYGVQSIRMAKSLMYFYSHAEMALPPNVSSNVC